MANLATCVPQYTALIYGFLLSIEIDGRGTVLTCNMMGDMFSWQSQASLGGFIGLPSAAFVSAVISGAAGTYVLQLVEDANVGTDLMIEPRQNVVVDGDPTLAMAPAWGTGGFSVQQFGSLSLSTVRLDSVSP